MLGLIESGGRKTSNEAQNVKSAAMSRISKRKGMGEEQRSIAYFEYLLNFHERADIASI